MAVWTELSPAAPAWSPSARRRAAVVAAVVAPTALYAGAAVLPWMGAAGAVGDVGFIAFLSSVLALVGALTGVVASSFCPAVLRPAPRRGGPGGRADLRRRGLALGGRGDLVPHPGGRRAQLRALRLMARVGRPPVDHDEVVRLYGPWAPRTPDDAVELFADYDGPWWVAGGWALEAFSGASRRHGDLDLSIPRADVPRLLEHLAGRFDVWAADEGTLRPLTGPSDELSDTCGNLWLRRDGAAPWEYDVLLADLDGDTWTYRRDRRVTRPVADLTWRHNGIPYLRPEVQLLHKAPGMRPVDRADAETCLPALGTEDRRWLRGALDLAHPGHPWIEELADRPS